MSRVLRMVPSDVAHKVTIVSIHILTIKLSKRAAAMTLTRLCTVQFSSCVYELLAGFVLVSGVLDEYFLVGYRLVPGL